MAKETTYEEIARDLKNRVYKPVYYLMGEESYYIDRISEYIAQTVLTEEEKGEYIEKRGAYYVADEITLCKGTKYNAIFSINAEIYQNTSIDEEVKNVLSEYDYRFNLEMLGLKEDGTVDQEGGLMKEIMALLNKISNV